MELTMTFIPTTLMLTRVANNGDTDSSLFTELLYAGELVVKLTTAGFISGIDDDRDFNRYSLVHGLVRADGLGEWVSKLSEAVNGPASQHMSRDLLTERRAFTERVTKGKWQYSAVEELQSVLDSIGGGGRASSPLGDKVNLLTWFSKFAELRNKTRGHGAVTPATCSSCVKNLRNSIELLIENNPLFQRSWAYIHRNLSGKYNIVGIGGDPTAFAQLKTANARNINLANGVYINIEGLRRVELLYSDLNVTDFFMPNGAFNGRTYELHSLITDTRLNGDAGPYLAVAGSRPDSETDGKGELDAVGGVFSNLPQIPKGYVGRPQLEQTVYNAVMNDRHPIVTLVGRGGIGKTSTALKVLHDITATGRFDLMVWFSARDIDLTLAGPKAVKPRVLAERDIAQQYRRLIGDSNQNIEEKNVVSLMADHMRASPLGPTLFVFDNFETVRSPIDLFQWIDTNIRLPNKIVITSRFREFKADFPIEVLGMERRESELLVSQTAIALNIEAIIGQKQTEQIIEDSDGHPYVIKISLGEIANKGQFERPARLIVRKDDILDALFDRTYANLSPLAARIFLTLSRWRSLVPQLGVEAVISRHGADGGDAEKAIDELVRMSVVERSKAEDGSDFLGVPLAAAIFANKKFETSPQRELIDSDVHLLQDIGATTSSGLREGIGPRINALFRRIARRIGDGKLDFEAIRPALEFVARSYNPAWWLLADLQSELEGRNGIDQTAEYVRQFLEGKPSPRRRRRHGRG